MGKEVAELSELIVLIAVSTAVTRTLNHTTRWGILAA